MKKIKNVLYLFLLILIIGSCSKKSGSDNTKNNGIYIGQTWILSALDPTNSSVPWSMTSSGISETVYMLDKEGNLYSRFIEDLEQTGKLTWKAVMKKDAKFSNGDTVNAEALCSSMNSIMEKNKFSNSTAGLISFTPSGDFSFDIKTERAAENMKSVFAEWSNIVFKDIGNGNFVFTGPYTVKNLNPGFELELEPNPHYPNADTRTNVTIKLFKDESSMKLAYQAGELDMAFTVTPEAARLLESENHIVKTINAGYQYFGIVNLDSKILKDKAIREAINLVINREDYIKALKGGRIAKGMFAQYYSFAGNSDIKYDMNEAVSILEKEGWKTASNGIREKNGIKLSLKIVTYPSRPDLITIMQIMTSQLQTVGIEAVTEIVDNIDERAKTGDFDLILYAQHTAPTANPSFFLNQFFRSEQSKNFSRFSSPEFDSLLDMMGEVKSGKEKDELAIKAQDMIFQELPVLYLIDPQWHIAVSNRLKSYEPYCGDYYIVNAELKLE